MSNNLKPCPFCGNEAIFISESKNSGRAYAVCTKCFAETKLYKNANAAIEAWNTRADERSKGEWINVKDRLPPKNTAVICLIKYEKPDKWYTYALLAIRNNSWEQFWGGKLLHEDYNVTHWMPLPEPPKGE